MELRFFISEYSDGNLCIECKHMHYAFRDDLNFDDFKPDELFGKMRLIEAKCREMEIDAKFVLL